MFAREGTFRNKFYLWSGLDNIGMNLIKSMRFNIKNNILNIKILIL